MTQWTTYIITGTLLYYAVGLCNFAIACDSCFTIMQLIACYIFRGKFHIANKEFIISLHTVHVQQAPHENIVCM